MNAPIGIFDSGIGGLTVARAVKDLLPQERIIYFGDTARMPYGNKSAATIQAYALSITDFLLKKKCKAILIACNSASAAAYQAVRDHVGQRALVLDVVTPMVQHLGQHFAGQPVGLIGTQQTVRSGVYDQQIAALQQGIALYSLATPLLAPMIEAGFTQGAVSEEVIHNYLAAPHLQQINALVLACTHYSVIKTQLAAFYQGTVPVLDATTLVAKSLKQHLARHHLLGTEPQPQDHFIVSDITPGFEAATQLFFQSPVHLESLPA